jgi:hypothetical protein
VAKVYSAALPIAYVVLRVLVILNWVLGAGILALLVATFVNEPWMVRALTESNMAASGGVMNGLRAVATLGIVAVPINHQILARLVAMVETVRDGNPFVAANAYRLQAIAWFLLLLQLLSLVIGAIGEAISTKQNPVEFGGFSIAGWVAVLLTFILARVFAEGTLMREDLDGTV